MKTRNGSMDLLRCLCMLFVVIAHLMGHSGYIEALKRDTMVYYSANAIASLVRVAVPVFVLITGYFGISFKLKKVVSMEITLLFYSLITFLVAFIVRGKEIEYTVSSILKTILPFSYNSWWYATCYMVLMLFAPFLNILVNAINQKMHISLIIICFVLFNVVASYSLDPIDTTGGYGFVNFCYLYVIGRYIRLYGLFPRIKAGQWIGLYFVFSALIVVSYRLYGNYKFGTYNSVLLLCSSISIFCAFTRINVKSTIYSKLAPYTFAVYLFSDSFYMRRIVNREIIDFASMADRTSSIAIMLLYGIVVMVVCITVDFIWKRAFGKINKRIAEVVGEKILLIWNKVIQSMIT